ncbi:helix-turn-helix domain-containing protein [Enterococcus sp. LJL120]
MNRIKELRKGKNMTLKELSVDLNQRYNLKISDGQLSNYENGKRAPRDSETWKNIAEYFGVSIAYLMGISDLLGNPMPLQEIALYSTKPIAIIAKTNKNSPTNFSFYYFLVLLKKENIVEKCFIVRAFDANNSNDEVELYFENYDDELLVKFESDVPKVKNDLGNISSLDDVIDINSYVNARRSMEENVLNRVFNEIYDLYEKTILKGKSITEKNIYFIDRHYNFKKIDLIN